MKDPVVTLEGGGGPRWISSPVTLHAVQCARCMKWRIIPAKEIYESIREHILEQPWMCESAVKWRPESNCDLPPDIEQDRNMLWAIDKPNLPSAPAGWERQITVRTDGSSKFADVYYQTPDGTRLRSKVEVEKYIAKYPDSVPPKTTMEQFSFAIPRPLPGVCPQLTGGKVPTSASHVEHDEEREDSPTEEDQATLKHEAASPPPSIALSKEDKEVVSRDSKVQQLLEGTQIITPETAEPRPLPTKRGNSESTQPVKRTKQQIKRDRLSKESLEVSAVDQQPPGDLVSSHTSDHKET